MLLNSWFRGLNFIDIGDQNYLLVTQLECISVYEYEIVFSAVNDELISISPQLTNYPNPFNPTTTISFSLPNEQKIELTIYNIKGQKVKTLMDCYTSPGEFELIWNGKDDNGKRVCSGVYFYKLRTQNNEIIRKMLLLK